MPRYLIALGSSHLSGYDYIQQAIALIIQNSCVCLHGSSRIYKNNAVETAYHSLFYNAVFAVRAKLHPHVFYRELAQVELILGRIRTYKNARRTIDIDILISLDFSYTSPHFFLPHREVLTRKFFVIPAMEALKSASWPTPIGIAHARAKFGREYLCPLP
jgi:2-amino-4-hydroxy-6-hydroxymethyldihydropteridine diphosphokinase